MKEIKLPIMQTYSLTIGTQKISKIKAIDSGSVLEVLLEKSYPKILLRPLKA